MLTEKDTEILQLKKENMELEVSSMSQLSMDSHIIIVYM